MSTTTTSMPLDVDNYEFNFAAEYIKYTSGNILFLTGKAGSGKTTFVQHIAQQKKGKIIILAPTGLAAVNAGGQTIHSFLQIPPDIFMTDDKRLRRHAPDGDLDKTTIYSHFPYQQWKIKTIQAVETIVIDEVRMVRCDLMDIIDILLRTVRGRSNSALYDQPFGGVQMILIGDPFQLPPVVLPDDRKILQRCYETPFFFSSNIIKQAIQQKKLCYIELKKIYRQNDPQFIELLNKIRVNQVSDSEIAMLNARYNPTFSPDITSDYITITTKNKTADNINNTKLDQLAAPLKTYHAAITGTMPQMKTPSVLQIKEGAQIMFTKNHRDKDYYNGTIGKIAKIRENTENNMVATDIIVDVGGSEILLQKETWENYEYTWNEREQTIDKRVIGTFTQYPIKLAWAITVHGSQGQTLQHVIVDVCGAWEHGQVYVALSRATSLHGMVLWSKISRSDIIVNSVVLEFAKMEMPLSAVMRELLAAIAHNNPLHKALETAVFTQQEHINTLSAKIDELEEIIRKLSAVQEV